MACPSLLNIPLLMIGLNALNKMRMRVTNHRYLLLFTSGAPRWNDEWIELQEKVFHAEDHFLAMCAADGVTNNNAEAHYSRIKNPAPKG